MEPFLLILDEPTSGLKNSSSQLLLKALRREAHEAVNVCMVVHQQSYSLFRMFDDLILLAKGGLVAYLRPVKNVEEYFFRHRYPSTQAGQSSRSLYRYIRENYEVKYNINSQLQKSFRLCGCAITNMPYYSDMKDFEVNSDSSHEGSPSTVGGSP